MRDDPHNSARTKYETTERWLPQRSPGDAGDEPGYVIHLPIRVGSADSAMRLARAVAGALDFLPELDPGETTVSTVDDQNNRKRVFCDRLLPDRSRCPRRYGHRGPCGPVEPRPVLVDDRQ